MAKHIATLNKVTYPILCYAMLRYAMLCYAMLFYHYDQNRPGLDNASVSLNDGNGLDFTFSLHFTRSPQSGVCVLY